MMRFVDLRGIAIPGHVIEMIPESICRENDIIPFAEQGGVLQVAIAFGDDESLDLMQKLSFILNREIGFAQAWRDEIRAAINRHFHQ
jgi:type IV pilus assembly protein PilB